MAVNGPTDSQWQVPDVGEGLLVFQKPDLTPMGISGFGSVVAQFRLKRVIPGNFADKNIAVLRN
jgi:hypothetical protein